MLTLSDFDYTLPDTHIAQTPVEPRDRSKLLIVNRKSGELRDKHFYDLADLLTPNDVLVINETKVFPARLMVEKENGKPVELLLEKETELTPESITFEVLTKPGIKVGERIRIPGTQTEGICTKLHEYTRSVLFHIPREKFLVLLDIWAKTPIPPYIKWNTDDEMSLRRKYQTVYAKNRGAVAAPTAGLHFTSELLEKIIKKGVQIARITLHVGAGTFLPVKTDDITKHTMHEEWFELDKETATTLNEAKKHRKRIIAVGTTTVRVLETCAMQGASGYLLQPRSGFTKIFIYPPYEFRFVDSLITNFHTPKSTLLMLVSALVSQPNTARSFTSFPESLIGEAYEHALREKYRFYSFGDAMWIV